MKSSDLSFGRGAVGGIVLISVFISVLDSDFATAARKASETLRVGALASLLSVVVACGAAVECLDDALLLHR